MLAHMIATDIVFLHIGRYGVEPRCRLVTTEAMVAEKPKKETPPAMPHGGGMDGMDDF